MPIAFVILLIAKITHYLLGKKRICKEIGIRLDNQTQHIPAVLKCKLPNKLP
jgi:hypothetical protein